MTRAQQRAYADMAAPSPVLFLLLLAATAAGTGCGDDDEERRPVFRTGVTPTVTVSGLDEPRLQQICDSLDVYVDAEISFDSLAYIACLPPAIVIGGDATGCRRELAECMAAFPEPITIQAQLQDTRVCFADLQACNATVSALERCVNVNLDLALQVLDWSCDGAAQDDLQRAAVRAMDTASVCAQIDASCQQFVELL
jgi:hypothetical protein